MYSFALKMVEDEDSAQEIVQEVFKSLWERKDSLYLNNSERYLLRSVKLKSIEYLRNKNTRQRHHDLILTQKPTYYEDEDIHYRELQNQLNVVVDSLPRQCKNVFKMSREEGLTNKEIAKKLLITERAVEYHITKALSVIKMQMKKCLNLNFTKSNA